MQLESEVVDFLLDFPKNLMRLSKRTSPFDDGKRKRRKRSCSFSAKSLLINSF